MISIMLSVILLLTNIGWVQTTHYCLGRPMDAHIGLKVIDLKCGMASFDSGLESMEQAPGCCHDESQRFSLDKHLIPPSIDYVLMNGVWSLASIDQSVNIFEIALTNSAVKNYISEEPPPLSFALFLLYDKWLI